MKVLLVKDIKIGNDIIKANQLILIDIYKMIAYFDDYTFTIEKDEFVILQ